MTEGSSIVGPLAQPPEEDNLLYKIREMVKAMIEEAITEAFADRESPSEIYELIQEYVTAPTLTKILKRTYQTFMEAGKMFVVQSEATGDGIYNCYEQKLLSGEWNDTAGDSKFSNRNSASVEVLNLGEYNPHSTYVAALIAGDLLMGWQLIDDVGTIRWVGAPFQSVGQGVRLAYCSAAAGAGVTIAATLDHTTGEAITVTCHISSGTSLNAALPRLADNDEIFVIKIGATWYCTTTFQGSEDCTCVP